MTTRVLVVDDEALLRTAFTSLIEAEEDLRVVGEAADGRQAVELAARMSPDVVVMDVRMPGMDGIEATRRITTAGNANTPRVRRSSRRSISTSTSSMRCELAPVVASRADLSTSCWQPSASSPPAKRCSLRA